MEQLELKHLIPYLPYGLKYKDRPKGYDKQRILNIDTLNWGLREGIPILRPLKEYENFPDIVEQFSTYSENTFKDAFFLIDADNKFDYVNYTIMELMFKYHLDIFGLIDKGLAIDVNCI